MTGKATVQDIINVGVEMYDNLGVSRKVIKDWLTDLHDRDILDADIDIESLFDLIIG